MTRRALLLVGLAVAFASSSWGQGTGSCTPGTAQAFVENAMLRASVFNTGGLFFGGSTTSGDGYLIPKVDGTSPVFAASLWVGGKVDGQLRTAGAGYGGYEFWPGPLAENAQPPADCSAYDRIYTVSRKDIQRYYETGELTDDLRDWPYELGAPVMDGDGDPDNYDLRAGDQPDLIGEQATWWIMNDTGNAHLHSVYDPVTDTRSTVETPPLGIEVRAQAFVYDSDGLALSPVLLQTSFYRYEILNRGDKPIDSLYVSMWADPDIGDAGDDYPGTDTLRHIGFHYNDSNVDAVYGGAPPAWGVQILDGPAIRGQRGRLTSMSVYGFGGEATDRVDTPQRQYWYMKGLWGDGSPYMERGIGYRSGGAVTTFMYPGDPVTEAFWSALNIDGAGLNGPNSMGRLIVVSTGPVRLAPGGSITLLYAMPYARGISNLDSVRRLQGVASALQRLHTEGFFTTSPVPRPEPTFELALSAPRPNPSRQPEARLTLPTETHVRATVYDALGRQLEVLVDGELAEGETVLRMPDGLAPGTYLLRVEVAPGAVETLTFTIVR